MQKSTLIETVNHNRCTPYFTIFNHMLTFNSLLLLTSTCSSISLNLILSHWCSDVQQINYRLSEVSPATVSKITLHRTNTIHEGDLKPKHCLTVTCTDKYTVLFKIFCIFHPQESLRTNHFINNQQVSFKHSLWVPNYYKMWCIKHFKIFQFYSNTLYRAPQIYANYCIRVVLQPVTDDCGWQEMN